jgi:hypothetical protein
MIVPALSLAAVLLVADPAPAVIAPGTPYLSPSLALALELGRIVGGARECALGDRANAAQVKAQNLIDHQAFEDDVSPLDMGDHFHAAIQAGRNAVLEQRLSCGEVETALKKLEGDRDY